MRAWIGLLLAVLAAIGVWAVGFDRDGPAGADPAGPPIGGSPEPASAGVPGGSGPGERAVAARPNPSTAMRFRSTPDDADAVADPSRDGVVVGFVDAEGRPLAAASVGVRWRKGFGLYGWDRGSTDAAGRFATTVPEVSMLEDVEATDPVRGIELDARDVPAPEDAIGREVFVRLPSFRTLRARVLDLGGDPVAGVAVGLARGYAFPAEPGTCTLGIEETAATTDPDGRVVVEVPEGIYDIAVDGDGVRPIAEWSLLVERSSAAIDVVLRVAREVAGRDVRVRVDLPPGIDAVPSVTITNDEWGAALGPGADSAALVVLPARRGRGGERRADGVFVVRGVESFEATLYVSCAGCERVVQPVPRDVTDVVVALTAQPAAAPQPVVHGQVVGLQGMPVQFARVGLCRDARIAHARFVDADREGRFEVPLPPRGAFVLTARRSGFGFGVVGPFDAARDPSPVSIELSPELAITGRVVDPGGNPVRDVNIWLHRPRGRFEVFEPGLASPFLAASSTDDMGSVRDDGSFRVDELGPGRYEIRAVPYDGLPFGIGRAVANAGQRVDIVLGSGFDDGAALVGRVIDELDGAPVADALVKVWAAPGGGGSRGAGEVRTDADGRFRCVGVSAGLAVIAIEAAGYAFLELPPRELAAGDNVVELAIVRAARLSLRIVDARGTPVGGVQVGISDGHDGLVDLQDRFGRYDGAFVRTDLAGRVDLRGVPVRPIRVLVGEVRGGSPFADPVRGRGIVPPGEHAFDLDMRAGLPRLVTLRLP